MGQILVEQGIMTATQLENYVTDYRSEYEIYDIESELTYEQKDMIEHLLNDINFDESSLQKEFRDVSVLRCKMCLPLRGIRDLIQRHRPLIRIFGHDRERLPLD